MRSGTGGAFLVFSAVLLAAGLGACSGSGPGGSDAAPAHGVAMSDDDRRVLAEARAAQVLRDGHLGQLVAAVVHFHQRHAADGLAVLSDRRAVYLQSEAPAIAGDAIHLVARLCCTVELLFQLLPGSL